MINPFDIIIDKLERLENKIAVNIDAPKESPKEIIDRNELCNRLNITEPTAIRWEKKGLIPCFRIGSSIRYNWPKVIEALENKKKGGNK